MARRIWPSARIWASGLSPTARARALYLAIITVGVSLALAWLSAYLGGGGQRRDSTAYPLASVDGDAVRVEFGPGSLETTSDDAWRGDASVVYPTVVSSDDGPVQVEVQGLNLAGIDYRGDPTAEGAWVRVALLGSSSVAYRIFSVVGGPQATRQAGDSPGSDPRAYSFHGYDGETGPHGILDFDSEPWGPEGVRDAYNTFDLRFRYDRRTVHAWVRLHASREWEEGGLERGNACARNVAMNSVVPGTEDSTWTGECRASSPNETGRPVGAWVPLAGGPWEAAAELGPSRVTLTVSNWEQASGPYRVTWSNVVLTGPPDSGVPYSAAWGRLRPFGSGRGEVEPRGEWAEFGFWVMGQDARYRTAARFQYRSPGLFLESQGVDWIVIARDQVRFAGRALVNGERGYHYEVRSVAGIGGAASMSLDVRSPEPAAHAYSMAFGSLYEGYVEINLPED